MKRYVFMVLAIATLLLGACKKDADVAMDAAVQHIPSDATQVTVIRVPQLLTKIDFEEMKQMDFYQDMISEAQRKEPTGAKILEDPTQSGINLKQNFYIVSDIDPNNLTDMVNGVLLNLEDAGKFSDMLKSTPLGTNVKSMDGYQYSTSGTGQFLAWSDEVAFLGQHEGNPASRLDKIFSLSEGASVLGTSSFEKVGASSDDISFWLSSDALAQNPQAAMGSSFLGYSSDDLMGNYINGGVNFDDKKMSVNLDFLLKNIIATDLNMPFKSSVKTDFSPYIPSKDLSSVFTFGFDVTGLLQLLKEKNAIGLLNQQSGLSRMGIDINDLADAIDGDMMLATQKTGSDGKPAGIFAMTVNSNKIQKYLNDLVAGGVLGDKGNGVYLLKDNTRAQEFHDKFNAPGEANQAYLIHKDNKIFLSADPALIEGIKNGGLPKGERVNGSLYNSITNGFIGGKGFPAEMEGMMGDLGVDEKQMEAFVISAKEGNINLEVISKEEGNFLKNMIKRNQK